MTLFLTAVWVTSTSILTVMMFRLWGGDCGIAERARTAFGWALADDREKARAMVRGFPAVCLACWGLALVGISVALEEMRPEWRLYGLPIWSGVVVGLGLLLVGVLLDVLIIRVNRPGFLVPPHLRWEPGYDEIERARARANSEGLTTPESAVEALYGEYADRWTQRHDGQSPHREL